MRAEMTREKAESALLELACSNHGCRVLALAGIRRGGMQTNGPCHCFRNDFYPATEWLRIQRITNLIEWINRDRVKQLLFRLSDVQMMCEEWRLRRQANGSASYGIREQLMDARQQGREECADDITKLLDGLKIDGTVDNWESGLLGLSKDHATPVTDEEMEQLRTAIEDMK